MFSFVKISRHVNLNVKAANIVKPIITALHKCTHNLLLKNNTHIL